MRIGKSHSLPCQSGHVRRRDFRARIVTAHIPIPHIICHDENNVPSLPKTQSSSPVRIAVLLRLATIFFTRTRGVRRFGGARSRGFQFCSKFESSLLRVHLIISFSRSDLNCASSTFIPIGLSNFSPSISSHKPCIPWPTSYIPPSKQRLISKTQLILPFLPLPTKTAAESMRIGKSCIPSRASRSMCGVDQRTTHSLHLSTSKDPRFLSFVTGPHPPYPISSAMMKTMFNVMRYS